MKDIGTMFKNGMRPVHPGEILREDYLVPLGMPANALAKALNVPAARINDIVRERRAYFPDAESVNSALRCLIPLLPQKPKPKARV